MTIPTNNDDGSDASHNIEMASASHPIETTAGKDDTAAAKTDYFSSPSNSEPQSSLVMSTTEVDLGRGQRHDDVIAVFEHDVARLHSQEEQTARAKVGGWAWFIGLMLGFVLGLFVVTPALVDQNGSSEESSISGGAAFGVWLLSFIILPIGLAFAFQWAAKWYDRKTKPYGPNDFTEYHTTLTNEYVCHVVKPGTIGIPAASRLNYGTSLPF